MQVYIGVEESKVFAKHLAIPWGVAGQRVVRACKEDGSAVPNVFLSCVCGREIDHRLGGLRPFIQGCKAEVQWVLQVRGRANVSWPLHVAMCGAC